MTAPGQFSTALDTLALALGASANAASTLSKAIDEVSALVTETRALFQPAPLVAPDAAESALGERLGNWRELLRSQRPV